MLVTVQKTSNRYQRRVREIAANMIKSRASEVASKQFYNVGGLLVDFGRPCDWDPSADYSDCVDENCSLTDSGYDLLDMWSAWVDSEINDFFDAQIEEYPDPDLIASFENFKYKD